MTGQANVIPMRPLDAAPKWLHWSEVISVSVAARLSGTSTESVRRWCKTYGIGTQTGKNASWRVSRPALLALLDGNTVALAAIKAGDKCHPEAINYYAS